MPADCQTLPVCTPTYLSHGTLTRDPRILQPPPQPVPPMPTRVLLVVSFVAAKDVDVEIISVEISLRAARLIQDADGHVETF